MLVSDAREAIKGDAPLDRLRSLTAELQQVYYGLSAAPSGDGGPTPGEPGGGRRRRRRHRRGIHPA